MKNIIGILAAALALSATSVKAADLGKGFALDSASTFTYEVEADNFIANQELELSYSITEGLTAFAYTQTNLRDLSFTGLDIGARYTINNFEVESAVQLDENFKYSELYVTLELNF
jgi:hypothetical protein